MKVAGGQELIKVWRKLLCLIDLDAQEVAMVRVGDGQNKGGKLLWLGREECAGDGLEGCAGGHDVINHQEPLALDEIGLAELECAANVGLTGLLRGEGGLFFG